ncbi:MAG TPA: hypothetical protein VJR89_43700 [Polyangiales bacterium]|nr:hypothetical protein [Polyangiales bacterium]
MRIAAVVLVLGCAACASDAAGDLPAGWEAAERVEGLMQAPCGGSALRDDLPETLGVSAGEGAAAVRYDHAHFRCVQDVEAYVKRANRALDVLVQPIDMHPDAVAGCDCLYDISMSVPAPRGDYTLTLYRRWDSVNTPNEPVKIGDEEVSIR